MPELFGESGIADLYVNPKIQVTRCIFSPKVNLVSDDQSAHDFIAEYSKPNKCWCTLVLLLGHRIRGAFSPVQVQLSAKLKGLARTISREDVPILIS